MEWTHILAFTTAAVTAVAATSVSLSVFGEVGSIEATDSLVSMALETDSDSTVRPPLTDCCMGVVGSASSSRSSSASPIVLSFLIDEAAVPGRLDGVFACASSSMPWIDISLDMNKTLPCPRQPKHGTVSQSRETCG